MTSIRVLLLLQEAYFIIYILAEYTHSFTAPFTARSNVMVQFRYNDVSHQDTDIRAMS